VFHKPASLRVARAFSDPPMNLLSAMATPGGVQLEGGPLLALGLASKATPKLTVGMRASAVRVQAQPGDVALPGKVELAEISGSDTFVHVHTLVGELVAQLTGVHHFELGAQVTLYFNPAQVYVFDAQGMLVLAPVRGGDVDMARIELDLAHAYRRDPKQDSDYALLPLKMAFEDGGAYALLGPSGCGKTTLLNIMSGLVTPSQGSVLFDGRDVTSASPQQRNIAQVFQFPVIYDTMTVAENLAFPCATARCPRSRLPNAWARLPRCWK
ncbi:MAG: ABC transporter ATP-binding protein, partial [Burkholderiales bacterium]|nr:ABC transporter ATP-binding protein [Burkholderiales bacterium]